MPPDKEAVVIEGGFGVVPTLLTVKVATKLVVFPRVSFAVTFRSCDPFASLVVSHVNV